MATKKSAKDDTMAELPQAPEPKPVERTFGEAEMKGIFDTLYWQVLGGDERGIIVQTATDVLGEYTPGARPDSIGAKGLNAGMLNH